jgi:hypothetical protein
MTKKRIVLADYKAEKRDKHAIEIEGENGEVFTIDPPHLWPDEVLELAAKFDHAGAARAILGDRYDAFLEAGGSGILLSKIVEDELRGSLGE